MQKTQTEIVTILNGTKLLAGHVVMACQTTNQ